MNILYEINEAVYDSKLYDHYVLMRCIFHDDKNPSLLVYEDKYKCLSCDAFGDTKDLLLRLQSHSIIPQGKPQHKIRNPFTRWMKEDSLFQVLKIAYHYLRDFPQQGIYLRKRKVTPNMISKLKLGYLDGFYLIPILDTSQKPVGAITRVGETIKGARYFVPRDQDPNLLFSPDWDQVRESKELYLTFGVFDAMAIHQCGKAAMSTTTGKRLHPSVLQDFRKRIIIFPDSGEEADGKKLANQLGWRGRVLVHDWPIGMKDPHNLFMAGQLQGILQ